MNAKPLTEQYLFKQSIRLPCVLALFIGLFSWFGHYPQFDSAGFNNFIQLSKLPIGILSLVIPFVAVVNNIHRTIQTNTQIEEAKKKNISDSYYSHFKHITDYYRTLPSKSLKTINSVVSNTSYLFDEYQSVIKYQYCISYPVHLYKFIYIDNSPEKGLMKSNLNYTRKITKKLLNIADECNFLVKEIKESSSTNTKFDDKKIKSQAKHINKIEIELDDLCKLLCINTPSQNYHFHYKNLFNNNIFKTNFGSTEEIAGTIEIIYQFMLDVLQIDSSFYFYDKTVKEKGTLFTNINYLQQNTASIYELAKIMPGATSPIADFSGGTLAAEH